MIQLPRLMDMGLTEIARLHPSLLTLTETLSPLSSAEMTLPEGEPEVTVGMFTELFTAAGSAGIFRVETATRLIGAGGGQRLTLQHALCTMSDEVLPGYVEFSGTAEEVAHDLLARQGRDRWQLGVAPGEMLDCSWENENLLTALLSLTESMEGAYMWACDFSTAPWTLSLIPLPTERFCEVRAGRSLTAARITVDRTDLCTRLYPLGYGEGADQLNIRKVNGGLRYLTADTAAVWGVVKRIWVEPSITKAARLKAAARRLLEKCKNPVVTVEVEADELCSLTGEALDRFRPGEICRLPLPDWGVMLDERVMQLHRPDVYGAPTRVTLTLANRAASAVDDLSTLARQSAVSLQYSQGAPSENILHFADVCDAAHPARLRFFLPEDAVNVNRARVLFSVEKYRWADASGVQESSAAASIAVQVDGTAVPDSDAASGDFDAADYLSADDDGRVQRGMWHEVTLAPDGPARIVAEIHLRTFIRSVDGANL